MRYNNMADRSNVDASYLENSASNGVTHMDEMDKKDRAETGKKGVVKKYFKRKCEDMTSNKLRNIIGFWIIGLCNNFPYVIMLSAAFDIIQKIEHNGDSHCSEFKHVSSCEVLNITVDNRTESSYVKRCCNVESTGVILLADILPTLIIKLIAPWCMHLVPYWIRILVCTVASISSFVLVASSSIEALVIFGVVCASIGSGFGEIVFLSYTSHFDKSTVSAWSSGTGAAGIGGAMTYLLLTTVANLSTNVTLYIQTAVPIVLFLSFLFILKKPGKKVNLVPTDEDITVRISDKTPLLDDDEINEPEQAYVVKDSKIVVFLQKRGSEFLHHLKLIPPLLKYMIPLFLVYVGEYLINQGLFELIYYPNTRGAGTDCFDQNAQYRWYQAVYQLGVFLSRSSVNIFSTRHVWIFAALQLGNFAFFFCEAVYKFLPSFWLMIVLVLYEGLLGGATYVNAFYHITKEVKPENREFSMGLSSVADTCGIALAGFLSIPIHNYICANFVPHFDIATYNSTLSYGHFY